jgi:deazaflavin-dependent oxidoreductase (nitroreductase family)
MDSNALARLKAVAGRQTLTLTHYGRKSGKPYDVTIWFAVEGDKVYIGTANVNRQWVRNVQKTPRIRLAVGGERFEGEAHFLAERAEHERAMAAIRRKDEPPVLRAMATFAIFRPRRIARWKNALVTCFAKDLVSNRGRPNDIIPPA